MADICKQEVARGTLDNFGKRLEARQKYIEEVFTMREHMTREEWNAAFASSEE